MIVGRQCVRGVVVVAPRGHGTRAGVGELPAVAAVVVMAVVVMEER